MSIFESAFTTINLQRYPVRSNETLRAWDAADELLLDYLAKTDEILLPGNTSTKSTLLIINDAFGALTCSLSHLNPQSWGDSHISHLAIINNANLNQPIFTPQCIFSTNEPSGEFDYVLIKIPKTLALLEQQLIQLKPYLHEGSKVVSACMVKHLHTSHLKLFAQYLGSTRTSLAVKKARLIFSEMDKDKGVVDSPYPTRYYDQELDLTICNHANVFSREKLDIGTRFMVKQFDKLPKPTHVPYSIVDLGCGNGLLGIMAKKHYGLSQKNLECQVSFVDESYMALVSAKENVFSAFGHQDDCRYFVSDCFEQTPLKEVDLILCNPPFHQNHAIGSQFATRMFKQGKQVLRQGGQMWVIGNRHLNYSLVLKRVFGNCQIMGNNKKFQIMVVVRR